MADLRGRVPPDPISFISMQFLAKILLNNKFLPQTQGLASPTPCLGVIILTDYSWETKTKVCEFCDVILAGSGRVIGADAGKRGGYVTRMTSPVINLTLDACLHFDYYVSDGARLDINMADPDATLFNRTRYGKHGTCVSTTETKKHSSRMRVACFPTVATRSRHWLESLNNVVQCLQSLPLDATTREQSQRVPVQSGLIYFRLFKKQLLKGYQNYFSGLLILYVNPVQLS